MKKSTPMIQIYAYLGVSKENKKIRKMKTVTLLSLSGYDWKKTYHIEVVRYMEEYPNTAFTITVIHSENIILMQYIT